MCRRLSHEGEVKEVGVDVDVGARASRRGRRKEKGENTKDESNTDANELTSRQCQCGDASSFRVSMWLVATWSFVSSFVVMELPFAMQKDVQWQPQTRKGRRRVLEILGQPPVATGQRRSCDCLTK